MIQSRYDSRHSSSGRAKSFRPRVEMCESRLTPAVLDVGAAIQIDLNSAHDPALPPVTTPVDMPIFIAPSAHIDSTTTSIAVPSITLPTPPVTTIDAGIVAAILQKMNSSRDVSTVFTSDAPSLTNRTASSTLEGSGTFAESSPHGGSALFGVGGESEEEDAEDELFEVAPRRTPTNVAPEEAPAPTRELPELPEIQVVGL